MSSATARRDYLGAQRWFVRSDGPVEDVEALPWSREPVDGLGVRIELVRVSTADGASRTYQVPAAYRDVPDPALEDALMAVEDGWFVYDAMRDAHARGALLAGFLGETPDGLAYTQDVDLGLTPETPTIPLVAEQSNTSIVVADRLLWKLFRIVGPGPNPDIEVGRTLTATGSRSVAPVRASISAGDVDLAMLYDYYPTATDGWQSARASVRDLLAEPGTPAHAAGGDFAGEARRLGATVAEVHDLMRSLGTAEVPAADLAARLRARFDRTSAATEWRSAAHRAFDELAALADPVPVQRVHGDLHLGQTLRTVDGWRVFDFEGEPAAPLLERRTLDSPLRDVAAMLRSFDYAPGSVLMQLGTLAGTAAALEWSERNSRAFLEGYGVLPGSAAFVLLRCYQVDKAAYEVDYELGHRPRWADIPRDALARLLG